VHFWDFGGQVMAHATHQFFLRSRCLYVVVLAGRADRDPNEDAEYWLEHVRAFGDNAPVLLVGNTEDVMQVNLDLTTLKKKFSNIVGFYSLSCTQAKDDLKDQFALFRRKFVANLRSLGQARRHLRFPLFPYWLFGITHPRPSLTGERERRIEEIGSGTLDLIHERFRDPLKVDRGLSETPCGNYGAWP
jgi:hypothetical protein